MKYLRKLTPLDFAFMGLMGFMTGFGIKPDNPNSVSSWTDAVAATPLSFYFGIVLIIVIYFAITYALSETATHSATKRFGIPMVDLTQDRAFELLLEARNQLSYTSYLDDKTDPRVVEHERAVSRGLADAITEHLAEKYPETFPKPIEPRPK